MEVNVGNARGDRFAWASVEEVGGSSKSFGPENVRDMGMEHERPHGVIDSADGPFSLAVLLGCVGARETQCGAMGS